MNTLALIIAFGVWAHGYRKGLKNGALGAWRHALARMERNEEKRLLAMNKKSDEVTE